jgi:hypothetical protein
MAMMLVERGGPPVRATVIWLQERLQWGPYWKLPFQRYTRNRDVKFHAKVGQRQQ